MWSCRSVNRFFTISRGKWLILTWNKASKYCWNCCATSSETIWSHFVLSTQICWIKNLNLMITGVKNRWGSNSFATNDKIFRLVSLLGAERSNEEAKHSWFYFPNMPSDYTLYSSEYNWRSSAVSRISTGNSLIRSGLLEIHLRRKKPWVFKTSHKR